MSEYLVSWVTHTGKTENKTVKTAGHAESLGDYKKSLGNKFVLIIPVLEQSNAKTSCP